MAKGGKEYRRLVAAFEYIFGATIFFGTDSTRGRARVHGELTESSGYRGLVQASTVAPQVGSGPE
jgi:hypothetical protein